MPQKRLSNWLVKELPPFGHATFIPQRFEDSTHELWLLEDDKSPSFLKVVSHTSSPFWQIMKHLFSFDLDKEISDFDSLYALIQAATPLQIPEVVSAASSHPPFNTAYVLASLLKGSAVSTVNSQMVKQLAHHVACLHQKRFKYWGCLNPRNTRVDDSKSNQWPIQLAQTLQLFSQQDGIHEKYLVQAMDACHYINTKEFVPMMPDLRWDQFLQEDDKLTALVDLDAFILAPRELDFVLLEYILTTQQHDYFIQTYNNYLPTPDISKVRPAYRLLLFLMQVLGETDIDTWMTH